MNIFKKLFSRKTNNENIIPEENNHLPNINIISTDNYIKMEIQQDCTFKEYCSELDKLSQEGVDEINQLPMRALLSKGIEIIYGQTVYLLDNNGFSYTVSVNPNNVYISSRKTESEEIKEATIDVNLQSKRYRITTYVHDLNRSTKSVKTYSLDEVGSPFSMTTDEARTTVDLIIEQLEQIEFIDEIVDLTRFKECLPLNKSQKFQKIITIGAHKESNIVSSTKMKSRAIIVNSEGKILIANYGGVYRLPGGSIDEGESPDDAIIRELKEEAGFELKYYSIEEIENLLEQNKTTNPRNEYFNREIKTIIQYYKKEKLRKSIER